MQEPNNNPTIVIVGASQGVGLACVQELTKNPHQKIIATIHSQATFQKLKAQTTPQITYLLFDITNAADRLKLQTELENPSILLTGFILASGIAQSGPLELFNAEKINHQFQTNSIAPITLLAQLTPIFTKHHTHVIVLGSIAATNPLPFNSIYAASKAALHAALTSYYYEIRDLFPLTLLIPGRINTTLWQSPTATITPKLWQQSRYCSAYSKVQKTLKDVNTHGISPQIFAQKICRILDHPQSGRFIHYLGFDTIPRRLFQLIPTPLRHFIIKKLITNN